MNRISAVNWRAVCVFALCLGWFASETWAQARPDRETKAQRVETPPTIDGVLDDAAWENAEVHTDFIDIRFDSQAKEQTFLRILYDDEYIYIGAEMLQDPTTILSTIFKYDRFELRFEDYIQVSFDTFHNKKSAYIFLLSPKGTRWDAQENVFSRSQSWDAVWDGETKIQGDRWIAEMRIPIGVMNHARGQGINWGINFRRSNRHNDEFSHWNYDPASGMNSRAFGPKFIQDHGLWTGLDTSKSVIKVKPEYEVYVSNTTVHETNAELNLRDDDLQFSTGVDTKLRINNNFVSQFTINPDFGQIEADADTIELRDTERFLPERRTFFQEGAEQFQAPLFLYNSRRITDIKAGAKVTGNGRNWNMGFLNIQGTGVASGDSNMMVFRPTYDVNDKLQVGGMVESVVRENGYNMVAAVDKRLELSPSLTWTTQYAHMFDRDNEAINGMGDQVTEKLNEFGFLTELNGGQDPFFWELGYRGISEDFAPDLGFFPRTNIFGPEFNFFYDQDFESGAIEGFNFFFDSRYYQDKNWNQTFFDFTGSARVEFRNDWDIRYQESYQFRDPYYDNIHMIEFEYLRQNRLKSWEVGLSTGTFQDVPFNQIELEKPFGIGERFTAEVTGTLRQEDPDDALTENIYLARFEMEYTFENELRARITVEESSTARFNRTFLLAYEDVGNWDFFFLFSDVRDNNDQLVRGAFTKVVYRF